MRRPRASTLAKTGKTYVANEDSDQIPADLKESASKEFEFDLCEDQAFLEEYSFSREECQAEIENLNFPKEGIQSAYTKALVLYCSQRAGSKEDKAKVVECFAKMVALKEQCSDETPETLSGKEFHKYMQKQAECFDRALE